MKSFSPIEVMCVPSLANYDETHAWMEARVEAIATDQASEAVWIGQHSPVLTAGTSAVDADLLSRTSIPVVQTGRGGEWTYHGPGQLVVYPLIHLRRRGEIDIKKYVATLEDWCIRTLEQFNIHGTRWPGNPGVWIQHDDHHYEKIAALGVRIRKGVAFHGWALNVDMDLSPYQHIVPCGIRGAGVTSMAHTLNTSVDLVTVQKIIVQHMPF